MNKYHLSNFYTTFLINLTLFTSKYFIFHSLIIDPWSKSLLQKYCHMIRNGDEGNNRVKVEMNTRFQIHIFWYVITHLFLSLNVWMYFAPLSCCLPSPYHLSPLLVLAQMGIRRVDLEHIVGWPLIGRWRGGDAAEWWRRVLPWMTSALKRQFSPKYTARGCIWELLQERLALLTPVLYANGNIIEAQKLCLKLIKWYDASSNALGKYSLNEWMKKQTWRD